MTTSITSGLQVYCYINSVACHDPGVVHHTFKCLREEILWQLGNSSFIKCEMQWGFFSYSIDYPIFLYNALFEYELWNSAVWGNDKLKLGFDGTKIFKMRIITLGAVSLWSHLKRYMFWCYPVTISILGVLSIGENSNSSNASILLYLCLAFWYTYYQSLFENPEK